MKSRFPTYNDGVLKICTGATGKSSFGAVKNALTFSDLQMKSKMAYQECSKRDEDMEFAESHGRTLSMKVKTRWNVVAKSTDYVVIGTMLYSIVKLDFDRKKSEMYFYPEEERELR